MMLRVDVRVRREAFELHAEFETDAGITALFGPSGSGKTTLLHALAGLVGSPGAAVEGRIELAGTVLFDSATSTALAPGRRNVGLVFQDLRLFPHLDVEGNLLYGWRRSRRTGSVLKLQDVVEALDLAALVARRTDRLSGGERQRVALGRALLAAPRLLLMDEPLASVDVGRRRAILPYLRWVQESLGVPVIYVSHALPEILELTDRIIVLDRGRITGHGEVFDVLGRTLHGAASAELSTETTVPITVDNSLEDGSATLAFIGEHRVVVPFRGVSPGYRALVAVRPEDVMLATGELTGVSARNQLRGEVERVTPLHGRLLVHVRLGSDAVLRAELTRDALTELSLDVGSRVNCVVKASAFRWVDTTNR